ncbi:MAG: lysine biosynthesis protein LysW [Planctomycetes bacterium]|nr:lysine biosynthesis protein LysW [Planctomycetota bacterium]
MSKTARCPDCRGEVRLVGRMLIGEVFGCAHCGAQIEVAGSDPLELEPFARVEEEEEDFV